MKPVVQTEIGPDNPKANCLMAALASILEVPLEYLPDIFDREQRGITWYVTLTEALFPYNLVPVLYDQQGSNFNLIAPKGYHIACGASPRGTGDHAVVAFDGKMVFDPHPSGAGLLDGQINWWILLMPLSP